MSDHVFISHSSSDASYVERIRRHLESRGVRCWMAPRDIPPGADWAESIMRALAAARAMVIVLSPRSNQSAQVRREVEHAVDAGVSIIPIIVDGAEPSVALRYYISSHQWMDASGGLDRAFLDRLADSLQQEGEGPAGGAAGEARAVVCPHCGAANPAGSRHCTDCGRRTEDGPSRRRLVWKVLAGFVILALLLFAGRAVLGGKGRRSEYRSARRALEEERWEDAYRRFRQLGDYADSRRLAGEALLTGIVQLHDSATVLRSGARPGARELWERLLEVTGEFEQRHSGSPGSAQVRLARADALLALGSPSEAAELYLGLARDPEQGRGAVPAAIRACEALLAAMKTAAPGDSAALLRREAEAADVLLSLRPPPGEALPLLDTIAASHCRAGSLSTAANLWRRAFLHARREDLQRRTAGRLAGCYRLMGDSTETRRWRLLAAGEIPPPRPDSAPAGPDSTSVSADPHPSTDGPGPSGPRQPDPPGDDPGGRGSGGSRGSSAGRR